MEKDYCKNRKKKRKRKKRKGKKKGGNFVACGLSAKGLSIISGYKMLVNNHFQVTSRIRLKVNIRRCKFITMLGLMLYVNLLSYIIPRIDA